MELRGVGDPGLARPVTAWPRPDGRLWMGLLAGVTVLRLAVAAFAPLSPDEAYYWVWSRALAPGYLDHPPMVALWIWAGTALAGQNALGVRLLGPLSAALGSALLWQAARDLLGATRGAWRAVVLLNATLLFGAGAVTMTPDTPLLFFWTAGLWAMARLIATGRGAWWLAAGAACGLAMTSKYTAVLFPAGVALWLMTARGQRRWLLRPWPWLGAVLAGALFVPTLLWNAGHDWASFAKQGGRNFEFHAGAVLGHLGELIGGQVALATPLIFVLGVLGISVCTAAALRSRAPGQVLLACLCLPGAALFVEHAIGDRVQANWPAIIYPAATIAAGMVGGRFRRVMYGPAIGLGVAMTMLVYVQSTAAPLKLSRRLDPTLRLSAGFGPLVATLRADAAQRHAAFIAADDYGAAALLAFSSTQCGAVVALEPRWALFRLPDAAPAADGRIGLLIRSSRRAGPPNGQDWAGLSAVDKIARSRGAQVAETYTVYQGVFRGGAEPAVLMPCRIR